MAAISLKSWRVLLVGSTRIGSLGGYCRDALSELGQTVHMFPRPAARRAANYPSLDQAWERGARLVSYIYSNLSLLRTARVFRPDIVFVLKGRWIHPVTLQQIRRTQKAILLNWNPDSPFNPINSSAWLIASIPLYDCHFTWGRFLVREMEKAHARRVEYLPFAYDPRFHFPVQPSAARLRELSSDVCFVGTWQPEREHILKELTNFDLGIWGNLWQERLGDERVRACWRGPAEYGRGMCEIYGAAKIVLNPIRAQNRDAHNMRTFEVPATGSFMLATRTEEQSRLLGEGEGVACFGGVDELREKIAYFLAHEDERRAIAARGHEIVAGVQHTYRDRMEQVLRTAMDL